MTSTLPYPPEYFSREDETDDAVFYASARKVVHLDDAAIATLRDTVFAKLLPPDAAILDLMSSWRSHLPAKLNASRVVGLGMNAEEMGDNPQLSEIVTHNLNQTPVLPFAADTFDAVLCTVAVQYLTHPVEVFREVQRVLKPGGVYIVSFSSRCFPSKAVWVWLFTDDEKHQELVADYFTRARFEKITVKPYIKGTGDPLYVVYGYKPEK